MASQKSAKYPYQWLDGSWHSEPWVQHQGQIAGNQQAQGALMNYGRSGGPQSPAALPGFPGGPPAPAAQAPAPVVPLPPDPNLELAKLQAGMNIGLSGAEGAWQTGQLQRSSGFDASGNLVTGGADYNPFSQAMLLQDAYKHSKAGTNTGYAAQGQLYSGAYGRAQARNDTNYAQGFDALKTGALQGYHGIGTGQLQTYANNAIGGTGAEWQSLYKNVYGS